VIDAATNDDRIHVMIKKGMNVYQWNQGDIYLLWIF
jgi:hypothetical protein